MALVLIGIGVTAIFAAFIPIAVSSPKLLQLRRQLKHLNGSDRRVLTRAFLHRRAIPQHLAEQAGVLAQLHWSQRFAGVTCAGLAVMTLGVAILPGQDDVARVTAWLSCLLGVIGAAVATRQALAGRRYLHRPLGERSGASARPSA